MVAAVETLLTALALLFVAVLAADGLRDLLRRRDERMNVSRLAAGGKTPDADPDRPPAPAGKIIHQLRAAGIRRGGPLTYLASSLLLAVLATLGIRSIIPGMPYGAVAGGALAAYLLWLLIKYVGRQRARRFELKLVDAVRFMISALKAGENLTQAFASAAEAADGIVRKEFLEVAHRLEVGMTVRRALKRIDEGYDSEGTRLFTRTIIAKWQVGGDLAPVLETVNRVIQERLRVRWRLHSQLAGARLAVGMVMVIPYMLIPFFFWQKPDWIDRLRDHPLGPRLLFGAVLLQILGVVWMRRIMRIQI